MEERNRTIIEKVSSLNGKIRDILKETLQENARRGNFIRIYPSKTSDVYDKYMSVIKPVNCILHKLLFSDELVPFPANYVQTAPSPQK